MKKFFRNALKILLWIVGSVIALLLIIILLIQIPAVQDQIRKKAVTYVENKIGTPVSIGKIEIGLPKKIILRDFYFQDQQQDTLLYGERLAVNISLFKLISNTVEINSVELEGTFVHLQRNKDSIYNYDYIVEAFSSEQQTTGGGPEINVEQIMLDRIRFRLDDAISEIDLFIQLDHFDTGFDTFNLKESLFKVPSTTLEGLTVRMRQGKIEGTPKEGTIKQEEEPGTSEGSSPFNIVLGIIHLSDIDIDYESEETGLSTVLKLGDLELALDRIDFQERNIYADNLEISDLNAALTLLENKAGAEEATEPENTEETPSWNIRLADLDFNSINFRFLNKNTDRTARGMDYGDLDISGLNLEAEDLKYSTDTISGSILAFTAKEKSGLDVKSLETDFLYSSTSSYLKNLYLETNRSLIREEIIIKYPSLASLGDQIGELFINASLTNTRIAFQDLFLFAPRLREIKPFKSRPQGVLQLDSKLTGKLGDLNIQKLRVSGIKNTSIALNGTIKGLPNAEEAIYDIEVQELSTTAADVRDLVPDGAVPDDIQLPEKINATASFTGTTTNFDTRVNLKSSHGNATVDAKLDLRENREKYDADISVNEFALGRLIKNDSLGTVTLNAKVQGTGFDEKTATATFSADIEEAFYNNYLYEDLILEGSIDVGVFQATSEMEDPNINFQLTTSGNFTGEYPAIELEANFNNVDLYALNLADTTFSFQGKVVADLETADPDYLNGEISFRDFTVTDPKGTFPVDSLNIRASATENRQSLVVSSAFLDASIEGEYKLTEVGTAVIKSISRYYDLSPEKGFPELQDQQFTFDIQLRDHFIVRQLVPQLELTRPIDLSGEFNSATGKIELEGNLPELTYSGYEIMAGKLNVAPEGDALSYRLELDHVESDQVTLPHTLITGSIEDDVIDYKLIVEDTEGEIQYRIAGELKTLEGATEISLNPDNLLLDKEGWDVPEGNMIRITDEGIQVSDFELRKGDSALKVRSLGQEPGSPLEVTFEEFALENVSSMISQDTLLASGTLEGEVVLRNLTTSPEFTSDLVIEDFHFRGSELGNLTVKAENIEPNVIEADVRLQGENNLLSLDGTYNTSASRFNLELDIDHLSLESLQGFTYGNLSESKGYFSGKLDVQGTLDNPDLNGNLKFNDIAFNLEPINTYFQSMNDEIVFRGNEIRLDNFSLSDVNKNDLTLDGRILTSDYSEFNLDLTVNSNNFKAISSTEEDGGFYYGDLFLDTNLDITGSITAPNVDGRITIREDTNLSIVIPQPDPSIAQREGVVEFVDESSRIREQTQRIEETVETTDFTGMNVSVNIESDEDATFTIIVDEGSGDYLKVQGKAQLTAGIDPSGNTSLIGRYEFTDGAYEMTFNLIKRKFEIEEGSYVMWTGEPTEANLNIRAIYNTEAAPIDLLENQLAGLTGAGRNIYKQQIPFETVLIIEGELLEPEISFDIRVADENIRVAAEVVSNTKAKLAQIRQQPAQMNKQVFSLLLLNRFIGEDPFASQAGGGAEMLARQSVSRILSQQLNKMTADLISGVQLNFELESREDYTTGVRETRTDLNVEISKMLLDDRLKVTIGSSFGLEGSEGENGDATNIAGDIALDYLLTKDGRYVLRAYRINKYQVALQGQIVETGVAFIVTMAYDEFMEIFSGSGKTEEEEEEEEEEE